MTQYNRRQFLKTGIRAGIALGGLAVAPALWAAERSTAGAIPDISVATGDDYFHTTINAIEKLGGIETFVSRGDTVGLLANSGYRKPGTYTRPDVLLAVAFLCLEAGAREVYCLKGESDKFWRRSPLVESRGKLISRLKIDESDHVAVAIPGGKSIRDAKVLGSFPDYDKVINIPIVKDHGEIGLTCTLKNTMGISPFTSNIRFHTGPNLISGAVKMLRNTYHNKEHLAQCISDLNRVRNFDLYVVDATVFITSNGPYGPGDLRRLDKVVAGTDRVAVDAFCCRYLDRDPHDEIMIRTAYENKLGEIDVNRLSILES